MESEKVKEIKKALENCQKNNCLDCPYFIDEKRCRANDLLLDTITLINELESENEKLRTENKILEGTKNRLTFADRIKLVDNAVEIKLKQFAERLKRKATIRLNFTDDFSILINQIKYVKVEVIDETLKEFIK